jgi:uncharacterized protein
MFKLLKIFIAFAIGLFSLSGCSKKSSGGEDYPIQPVPFTAVKLTDNFWAPRIKKNASVTIPIAFGYCESTGRVKNFEIAAGLDTGKFKTIYPFDDSDVYKIIEGASYSLQTFPDPKLEEYLDTLIHKIGLAQEPDGYLYTNRTIAAKHGGAGLHEWAGKNRWELDSVLSHELYNLGHLYEAAVAHYEATGKRTLLNIALKSADLVNKDFGYDKVKVYPGHQVIEMGLVKLYRVTGERKFLDLARFFLDIRGPHGQSYNQADIKPVDQTEAEGHAVRATYMYSGMADIAAIEKDNAYLNAITKIWEDIVYGKIYLTGGIGATGGNEGFAEPYLLPNMSAYCETCASIGDIFFNHRLFLLHGQSKYIDILEKTLYNSMLSGVSLSADRFFYPNPLESDGRHKRQAWFGCACCPSNVARFVPAIPGYVYAVTDKELYINLFISNNARVNLGKRKVSISQKANFPWDGKVEITVNPEKSSEFNLKIRIPDWAQNEAIPGGLYKFTDHDSEPVKLMINGEKSEINIVDGYALISRKWKSGDKIEVDFPMPVRRVVADEKVKADRGKIAFQRGPVIFCAEWPDNNTGNVLDLVIKKNAVFTTEFEPLLLNGTQVIKTTGVFMSINPEGKSKISGEQTVKLIPYALWNNRGAGQMRVWFPINTEPGYYVDKIHGDDNYPGTVTKPIKSIRELNIRLQKKASDIFLAGGQTFDGTLVLSGINGNITNPIRISSWGEGKAVINGGNAEAVRIENCQNILITDLDIKGNGRKNGNSTNGLSIAHSRKCKIENVRAEGFQKSGVDLFDCSDSEVEKVVATDNGFCGINIMGSVRNNSRKIIIHDCKAENNPGDPTNLNNHSGNGILVGVSDSVTIDHCSATDNGWDMPRKGNGPVGIWTWESDHVTIQYCISYRNKTSKNANDGGGFDLDGGVTNSVIQYCLSYENQGAGYGLFQYAGASSWANNIIRYCVSINDGQTTEGAGGIFIWNGSDDVQQLTNCMIYNNVMYNSAAPLISFDSSSAHKDFTFFNNIFMGSDSPIKGIVKGSTFLGNDWWSTKNEIMFMKFKNLAAWAEETGQEMLKGRFIGMQMDPKFKGPMLTDITDPNQLEKLYGYILQPDSPLRNKGLDLKSVFGLEYPAKDFYGNPVPKGIATEPGIYEMK